MGNKTGGKCCLFPALRVRANVGIAFSDMEECSLVIYHRRRSAELPTTTTTVCSAVLHVSCLVCSVARGDHGTITGY